MLFQIPPKTHQSIHNKIERHKKAKYPWENYVETSKYQQNFGFLLLNLLSEQIKRVSQVTYIICIASCCTFFKVDAFYLSFSWQQIIYWIVIELNIQNLKADTNCSSVFVVEDFWKWVVLLHFAQFNNFNFTWKWRKFLLELDFQQYC